MRKEQAQDNLTSSNGEATPALKQKVILFMKKEGIGKTWKAIGG